MTTNATDTRRLTDPVKAIDGAVPYDPLENNMIPLGLWALDRREASPMDIYLPIAEPGDDKFSMSLICKRGDTLEDDWWNLIDKFDVRSVCIKPEDIDLAQGQLVTLARSQGGSSSGPGLQKMAEVYKEVAAMSVRAMLNCQERDRKQIDKAADLAKKTIELMVAESELIDHLQFLVSSSRAVFQHSVNVCLMSLVLGRQMGMDKNRLAILGMGSLLHDIGLGKVPKDVLNKPGPLSEEEWSQVRKHPRIGHQQLSLSPKVPYDSLNIVLNHHEKPDGSGYPTGLKGNSIPFAANLVRVVDMYDAMTSPRPYRKAMQPSEAVALMLEEATDKGTKEILSKFIRAHSQVFI